MEISLVMFKTDGTRREFPLKRESLVVGRTSDADLRIPLPSVSRKHCEFTFDGTVVTMRDLGSSNGTLHNSTRVEEAVLAAGDRIEVGPVSFYLVVDGEPAELMSDDFEVDPQASDADVALALPVDEDDPTPATAQTIIDEIPEADAADVEVTTEADVEPEPEVAVVENAEPEPEPEPEPIVKKVEAKIQIEPAATSKIKPPPPVKPAAPKKPVETKEDEELDLEEALANAASNDAPSSETPAEPESEEFEDPIAALQALADAENASNNEFASFFDDEDSTTKDGK